MNWRTTLRDLLALAAVAGYCSAAHLSQAAETDFQTYLRRVEARLLPEHNRTENYIGGLDLPPSERTDVERQLRSGCLRIEPIDAGGFPIEGGLVHHWRGDAFVAGAKREDLLRLLTGYDRLSTYYAPEIQRSRALTRSGFNGERATLAVRLKEHEVLTVVLDAEYQAEAGLVGENAGFAFTRSIHIWQVDGAGTAHERRRPEGEDDGYLWRLNGYWRFREVPDGLLIECDAISLTRDIPAGLGWLIGPILQKLPRSSLEFTLEATRKALATKR